MGHCLLTSAPTGPDGWGAHIGVEGREVPPRYHQMLSGRNVPCGQFTPFKHGNHNPRTLEEPESKMR